MFFLVDAFVLISIPITPFLHQQVPRSPFGYAKITGVSLPVDVFVGFLLQTPTPKASLSDDAEAFAKRCELVVSRTVISNVNIVIVGPNTRHDIDPQTVENNARTFLDHVWCEWKR